MGQHDYNKVREIGSGSFGKAWLVTNKDGRTFVMKVVDTTRMSSKERKGAMNEAKVLAALKHPYIVNYRESFMDGQKLCIVMDYAEKGDLFKTIDRARRKFQKLSEAKVLRWITQCLLGCKYLHEKHILHRDIKSANVFISASGRCKLGDFGISRVLEHTNCFAKTSIGTPYYLAPEICQQRPYAWPADIWALGCILYEMCTLKVPFDAQNFKQLCDRIIRGPAPRIGKDYSEELRDVCSKMLSLDPRARPSAAELLQRPIIQKEIRRMLEEEKEQKAAAEPAKEAKPEAKPLVEVQQQHPEGKAARPPTPKGVPPRHAGPENHARHRDPSPRHGHHREPSPAARQIHSARGARARSPMHGAGLRY